MSRFRSIWSELPAHHRRFLLIHSIIVAAFINLVLNGVIAWLSVRGEEAVPLWAAPGPGNTSTAVDTAGTFFVLPLLTCLIFTTVARREVRAGRLPTLGWSRGFLPFLERLPAGTLRRGLVLGAACMILLAPFAVGVLVALDFGDLTVGEFVAYKAVFGVVLGAIVTPVIALWALADASGPEVARPGIEPGTP